MPQLSWQWVAGLPQETMPGEIWAVRYGRENISVDIITVHGHEHVVVINGMAFRAAGSVCSIRLSKDQRMKWVAGQGVIYCRRWSGKTRCSGKMA